MCTSTALLTTYFKASLVDIHEAFFRTSAARPLDHFFMSLKQYLHASPWICAPMVHQSELTFRLLCRRYNVSLAATPMLHSRIFASTPEYRAIEYQTHPLDQPLIAQLCASEPHDVVNAAQHLGGANLIDLNFGCPQQIAKRGNYGAFLLTDVPKMQSLVNALVETAPHIPVSCKIRLLPSKQATLNVATALIEAGAQMLTVHGRTREQNKQQSGAANWKAVRSVVAAVREQSGTDVVVVSNGGVGSLHEAQASLDYTGADGVMAAEGLLCNPAMFYEIDKDDDTAVQEFVDLVKLRPVVAEATVDRATASTELLLYTHLIHMRQLALAQEYLALAKLHSNQYMKPVRSHVFKLCHAVLTDNTDVRVVFGKAKTLEHMEQGIAVLVARTEEGCAAFGSGGSGGSVGVDVIRESIEWARDQSEREKQEVHEVTAKFYVAAAAGLALYCNDVVGQTAATLDQKLWYTRHPRM